MKKKVGMRVLFLIIALITIPGFAFAASVGNPDTLGKSGAASLGIEHDVSTVNLELEEKGTVNGERFGASNMLLKTQTTYVVGTVGILPNLDAFVGLGISNAATFEFDMNHATGKFDVESRDNSPDNFAVKLGARAKIAEVAGIKVGATGQYLTYHMNGDLSANGNKQNILASDTKVHEWHAAVTASKRMGRFNPYAGVTYSTWTVEHNTTLRAPIGSLSINAKARQDDRLGGVIGTSVNVWENIDVNAEGRFGNEEALTVGALYRF